jgi:uncharacterized protein YecA (UPF0149 family)
MSSFTIASCCACTFGLFDLSDLVDAYQRLGGPLPNDLAEHVEALKERWQTLAAERQALEARTKIGRNDPCPCGSGKKYKKCCLASV